MGCCIYPKDWRSGRDWSRYAGYGAASSHNPVPLNTQPFSSAVIPAAPTCAFLHLTSPRVTLQISILLLQNLGQSPKHDLLRHFIARGRFAAVVRLPYWDSRFSISLVRNIYEIHKAVIFTASSLGQSWDKPYQSRLWKRYELFSSRIVSSARQPLGFWAFDSYNSWMLNWCWCYALLDF